MVEKNLGLQKLWEKNSNRNVQIALTSGIVGDQNITCQNKLKNSRRKIPEEIKEMWIKPRKQIERKPHYIHQSHDCVCTILIASEPLIGFIFLVDKLISSNAIHLVQYHATFILLQLEHCKNVCFFFNHPLQ